MEKRFSKDERQQLLEIFLKDRDNVKNRNALISAHFWVATMVARKYAKIGIVSFPDLYSEGVLGLIKAAERYETGHGTIFSTYSAYWVRAYIEKEVGRVRGFQCVKPVRQVQQAAYSAKKTGDNANVPLVALSLDAPMGEDGDASLYDKVNNNMSSHEKDVINRDLVVQIREAAYDVVRESKDPHCRSIIDARILAPEPLTLAVLGELLGISRQRVEQKEKQFLKRIKERLNLE